MTVTAVASSGFSFIQWMLANLDITHPVSVVISLHVWDDGMEWVKRKEDSEKLFKLSSKTLRFFFNKVRIFY